MICAHGWPPCHDGSMLIVDLVTLGHALPGGLNASIRTNVFQMSRGQAQLSPS